MERTMPNFQSQRSSCERCRQQKLKCVVSLDETNGIAVKCDRCIRAKCDYVFSPRSQSKRARITQDLCGTRSLPSPVSTSEWQSKRGSVSAATLDGKKESPQASFSSAMWNDIHFSPVLQSFEREILAVQSSRPSSAPLGEELLSNHSVIYNCQKPGLSVFDQDVAATSWQNSLEDDWLNADIDALNTATLSSGTSSHSMMGTEEQRGSEFSSNASWTAAAPYHNTNDEWEIVTVLGSIQRLIKSLLESPWQQDPRHSLSQYPVGAILSISRKFGTLMSTNLITDETIEADTGCARSECSSRDNISTAPYMSCGTNTTSMLLMLGGYSWLLEVYKTVFTHLKSHLELKSAKKRASTIERAEYANRNVNDTNTDMTTTLSEIPTLETSDLIRLHLAVCMLQTELEQLGTRVNKWKTATCKMAVSLLEQEVAVMVGSNGAIVLCGRLGKQLGSIKLLLKEILGFSSVSDML